LLTRRGCCKRDAVEPSRGLIAAASRAKAEVDSEEWQQKVSEARMKAELQNLESFREEHSVVNKHKAGTHNVTPC
jgi:hypothetical protein